MRAELAIRLTWSKIMAFVVLACAMFLDIRNGGSTTFMFSVPFAAGLIVGKQYFDRHEHN